MRVVSQLLQTLLGILSLLIAVWTLLAQRKRKRLSYDYSSISLGFLSAFATEEEKKRLLPQVPSQQGKIVIVDLTNSGNLPILSSDFVQPVTIEFDDPAEILAFDGPVSLPANLETKLSIKHKKVTARPTLMNPGDSIRLSFLIENFAGKVNVSGHVAGVSKISRRRVQWPASVRIGMVLVSLSMLACFVVRLYTWRWNLSNSIWMPLLAVGSFGILLSYVGFLRFLNRSKESNMFKQWRVTPRTKTLRNSPLRNDLFAATKNFGVGARPSRDEMHER